MDDLANEGVLPAGESEIIVPYRCVRSRLLFSFFFLLFFLRPSLTLQWLESNPNQWPVDLAGLLRLIERFCDITVDQEPMSVISSLEEYGCLALERAPDGASDTVLEKLKVTKVSYGAFEAALAQMREQKVSRALRVVNERILKLLEVYHRMDATRVPGTRQAMLDLVSQHTQVTFRAHSKAVLAELEANDFVEVDATTDELVYDGPKIVNWKEPPTNKGFGIGSFLLVVLIILMMTPNLLQKLGIL